MSPTLVSSAEAHETHAYTRLRVCTSCRNTILVARAHAGTARRTGPILEEVLANADHRGISAQIHTGHQRAQDRAREIPFIDIHSHHWNPTPEHVDQLVKEMD